MTTYKAKLLSATLRYVAARLRLAAEALCSDPGDESLHDAMMLRADEAEADARIVDGVQDVAKAEGRS